VLQSIDRCSHCAHASTLVTLMAYCLFFGVLALVPDHEDRLCVILLSGTTLHRHRNFKSLLKGFLILGTRNSVSIGHVFGLSTVKKALVSTFDNTSPSVFIYRCKLKLLSSN
jgi:hypothetical protein